MRGVAGTRIPMNHQRYMAYRSLISELADWRAADALAAEPHEELRDAAEGMLLARARAEAEEPLTSASATVLELLASDGLEGPDASWILDTMLACGPQATAAEPLSDAA
jgi:hypothetical protein